MATLMFALAVLPTMADLDTKKKKHHHHHHKHGHHHGHHHEVALNQSVAKKVDTLTKGKANTKPAAKATPIHPQGQILVNGPLPHNFPQLFAQSVAQATGSKVEDVKVLSTQPQEHGHLDSVVFEAPAVTLQATQKQAADPDSKLARGPMHLLLVAKDSEGGADADEAKKVASPSPAMAGSPAPAAAGEPEEEQSEGEPKEVSPSNKALDVDTQMPFGQLEPFGREDTAQELTESSIAESNQMVDQLERAEVAEEKRAVFRALTRLRGAAITSFDGVARAQTGNIDEYSKKNSWREAHPLRHLAQEEADVSKWAFPSADF
jgi:hypothetical protein